jgi:hypothetical protein
VSIFAVTREAGPAWVDGGIFDQPAVDEHAAFMNELAEEGVVLFAGPVAGTERGRLRALLIVQAGDEAEIHRRFADDPWAIAGRIETMRVEPWTLMVGSLG